MHLFHVKRKQIENRVNETKQPCRVSCQSFMFQFHVQWSSQPKVPAPGDRLIIAHFHVASPEMV